jgi:hypothetical protein
MLRPSRRHDDRLIFCEIESLGEYLCPARFDASYYEAECVWKLKGVSDGDPQWVRTIDDLQQTCPMF